MFLSWYFSVLNLVYSISTINVITLQCYRKLGLKFRGKFYKCANNNNAIDKCVLYM